MADVLIQDPVINSPFREPERHSRFGEDGNALKRLQEPKR